jgi:seryl-tRNA synthetase
MLEAKYIREHMEEVREKLVLRDQTINLDKFLSVDEERRKAIQEWEKLRALQKKVSDEVSKKKREGIDASELIAEMKKVSQELKRLDDVVEEKEIALQDLLLIIPNLPHDSVPKGKDSSDNVEVRRWGSPIYPLLGSWGKAGEGTDQFYVGPSYPRTWISRGAPSLYG